MNYTILLIIHAIILISVFVLDLYEYIPKWLKSFVMAFSLTLMVFILLHTAYLRYKYGSMFTQEYRDQFVKVTDPKNLKKFNALFDGFAKLFGENTDGFAKLFGENLQNANRQTQQAYGSASGEQFQQNVKLLADSVKKSVTSTLNQTGV